MELGLSMANNGSENNLIHEQLKNQNDDIQEEALAHLQNSNQISINRRSYRRQYLFFQVAQKWHSCINNLMMCSCIITLIYALMTVLDGALRSKAVYKILALLATSAFMVILIIIALVILRKFPSQVSETSTRQIIRIFYKQLLILNIIGILTLSKLGVSAYLIRQIESSDDRSNQRNQQILYLEDILYTSFAFLCYALIVSFEIFSIAVILFSALLDLLIFLPSSCCRVSILRKIFRKIYRVKEDYLSRRIDSISSYQGEISIRNDSTFYDSDQMKIGQPCQICLEEFQPEERVYRLPCVRDKPLHYFHTNCLETWAMKTEQCPACRKKFDELQQQQNHL